MCVHHSVHLSMQLRSGGWNPRPRGKPLVVGLEWQPKLFVVDTQVAVVTADDSIRPHGLNFLRHYADITLVAAVVAEAIEAEAIVEMPEQDDMVLERDVGTSSATATAAAATAAACARATTTAAAAARACHARLTASSRSPRGSAATAGAGECVSAAAAAATRTLAGAGPAAAAAGPLTGAGPIAAAWTIACTCTATRTIACTCAATGTVASGAVAPPEVRAVTCTAAVLVAPAHSVGDAFVVVTDALPVLGPVVPSPTAASAWPIDVDVVVIPVDVGVTAPITSAAGPAGPAPNRIARAKCQARAQNCAAIRPVAGAPVVRRVRRVRPCTINDRRVVIRHIHRLRVCRLDDDDLLAAFGPL